MISFPDYCDLEKQCFSWHVFRFGGAILGYQLRTMVSYETSSVIVANSHGGVFKVWQASVVTSTQSDCCILRRCLCRAQNLTDV
jgi:hypothetical protein